MKDGNSLAAEDYTFDQTGNITQPTGLATYHAITDRLLSRVNGVAHDSLRYDRAGNLVRLREASGVIWEYGYDGLERLVSVRRNSTLIARYGYDVLGRRIVKRVYSSASGGTVAFTRFVYRGGQVGFETDSSAVTIGLKYTYGGTDNLLAITDDTTHYYVTTDKLGSVRSLAKRDGTWALTQRFHPYGARIARDTSASYGLGTRLRYGWTGREYDAETGMSFHRARYYLPVIRRWTQEDPIGYAGGGNLYAYVGGAPLEARDPSGLADEWQGPGPTMAQLRSPFLSLTVYCGLGGISCTFGGGGAAAVSTFGNLANSVWVEQRAGLRAGQGRSIIAPNVTAAEKRDCRNNAACRTVWLSVDNNADIPVHIEPTSTLPDDRIGQTYYLSKDRIATGVTKNSLSSIRIFFQPSHYEAYSNNHNGILTNTTITLTHELGHAEYVSMINNGRGTYSLAGDEAWARYHENWARALFPNGGQRDAHDR